MAGRKLGQHFLLRGSVLERIARAGFVRTLEPLIIEIGPGRSAWHRGTCFRAPRV